MINFHCVTKEDIKQHTSNWPEIPDHPYQILKLGFHYELTWDNLR